ncbi:hypothetical protein NQ314_018549 [Rhamnusium bicolor]|uniref:Uncharacterized protein n=1 Tax=Rhamnusium bicolor TaxID=1586634 RepID=A0AAV8WQN3_9CUCU|nr:hypothetical protein NQ314_018549 [Rhamnusium bicolor]
MVHYATKETPTYRLMNREVKTTLDLLKTKTNDYRNKLVENFKGSRDIIFRENESVFARDYRNPNKKGWKKAVIEEVLGERTYFVRVVDEDVVWKRHTDQLIKEGDFYERCRKIESEKEIDGNDLITSAETVVNLEHNFSKDQNEIINSEVESKLARDVKEQGNLGNGNLENNIDSSQIVSKEESIVAKENVLPEAETNVNVRPKNVLPEAETNVNVRPKRTIKKPTRLDL